MDTPQEDGEQDGAMDLMDLMGLMDLTMDGTVDIDVSHTEDVSCLSYFAV